MNTWQRRPAEIGTGLAGAIAILIAYLANITDPVVMGALIVIVAAVPGIITWIVNFIRSRPTDGS